MADKNLRDNVRAPASDGQEGGDKRLQAVVDPDLLDEIADSFRQFGFDSTPDGLRTVCRCFVRSSSVREAVRQAIPDMYRVDHPAA